MRKGLDFRKRRRTINIETLHGVFIWLLELLLAFSIACAFMFYFGTIRTNVGQSMEPNVYSGDKVLINKLFYIFTAPDYGDVIVFQPHGNEKVYDYVKRVVGCPGDKIQIKSGRVFIDGEPLEEKVQTEPMTYAGMAEEEFTLGKDEFFVLGDNRNNSEDSRSPDIGLVLRDDILGEAWFVISPSEHFGFLK